MNKTIGYMLSETTSISKPEIISSSSEIKKNNNVSIKTELQDSSEQNRNRRRYPKIVLENGFKKPHIQELLRRKSWVGEAGHPVNPTIERQMTIDNKFISHRINSIWWEGEKLNGIVETMPTRYGSEMKNLILSNLEVAFSLRATGPVQKTPQGSIVQDPITILTYDWVFIPSHSNSYQKEILMQEATNLGQNLLSESYCVPIYNQQAIDYIKDKSENYKLISDMCEFENATISLSENNKSIIIDSNSSDKCVVKIEDYLSHEIDDYLNKFMR